MIGGGGGGGSGGGSRKILLCKGDHFMKDYRRGVFCQLKLISKKAPIQNAQKCAKNYQTLKNFRRSFR